MILRKVAPVALLLLSAHLLASPNETQSFVLQPGWNAIFVDVQPEPSDPAMVFGSVPIESVWTWNRRPTGIDFLKDSTEVTVKRPGWLGFFPATSAHAFLTNLHSVRGNRAYLVKLSGTSAATLQIVGKPAVQPFEWVADSFNLVGFKIDPATPPTFASFLAASPAHTAQPVYTLSPAGAWSQVSAASESIQPGTSYWVYTRGASSYQGPLSITVPQVDSLEFGNALTQLELTITNRTASDATVTATLLNSAAPPKLLYWQVTGNGDEQWVPLTSSLTRTVRLRSDFVLRLGVDRSSFGGDRVESILEVKTSSGARWAVPVGASRGGAATPLSGKMRSFAGGDRNAGLWVGTVSVEKVSQAQNASTTPVPVNKSFDFRIMVHVSDASIVHLLKEVIQMWQNGTYNPDRTVATPGRYVLLSDDSLTSQFEGASIRDGVPVGKRLSAAAYDFAGDRLLMTGSFGPPNSITQTLSLPAESPTNPFRHKYHPDHDNLDPLFIAPLTEAYPVTRELTLSFSATDPSGETPPGWGDSIAGGTYRETMTGLHKHPIYLEGTFRLVRVCAVGVLN